MKKLIFILLILTSCSHKVYYWHVDKNQKWTAKPYPQVTVVDSTKKNSQ